MLLPSNKCVLNSRSSFEMSSPFPGLGYGLGGSSHLDLFADKLCGYHRLLCNFAYASSFSGQSVFPQISGSYDLRKSNLTKRDSLLFYSVIQSKHQNMQFQRAAAMNSSLSTEVIIEKERVVIDSLDKAFLRKNKFKSGFIDEIIGYNFKLNSRVFPNPRYSEKVNVFDIKDFSASLKCRNDAAGNELLVSQVTFSGVAVNDGCNKRAQKSKMP